MKTCTKCKIEKPFEAFHRDKNRPDGYVSSCAECEGLRRLELKKNPLKQLEKEIKSSVILENKLLKRENKKLCIRCKEAFLIDDLVGGHICKDCSREKSIEYRETNKEKTKEINKEYREKKKENIREYMKEYSKKNKEKKKEITRKYCENNKEKIKERKREYYEKNKEKFKEYNKEYRLKKKLEKQNNT